MTKGMRDSVSRHSHGSGNPVLADVVIMGPGLKIAGMTRRNDCGNDEAPSPLAALEGF